MKVGILHIIAGYANDFQKRYRLKKGEYNGMRKNERKTETNDW